MASHIYIFFITNVLFHVFFSERKMAKEPTPTWSEIDDFEVKLKRVLSVVKETKFPYFSWRMYIFVWSKLYTCDVGKSNFLSPQWKYFSVIHFTLRFYMKRFWNLNIVNSLFPQTQFNREIWCHTYFRLKCFTSFS